jgi:hypothetical protein
MKRLLIGVAVILAGIIATAGCDPYEPIPPGCIDPDFCDMSNG